LFLHDFWVEPVQLGKDATAIREDLKSADWKLMLAAVMKRYTSATNVWITERLNMGIPQAVSRMWVSFISRVVMEIRLIKI
jgi:hypothetical protein